MTYRIREILNKVENRNNNFNAQTWLDIRVFADICLYYQRTGLEIRTAIILRDCVERVHAAIVERLPEGSTFTTAGEAIEFIQSVGISTVQMKKDNRARKKISDALTLEERFLDGGGTIDMLRNSIENKQAITKSGLDMSKVSKLAEQVNKMIEKNEEADISSYTKSEEFPITSEDITKATAAQQERNRVQKERDAAFIASMTKQKEV